jgi:hypothetical protein
MAAATQDAPRRRRGVSLAKGPVALIGLASLAFGILGFAIASQSFTTHAWSGVVNGGTFLGVEGNGWTWAVFAAGGLLLVLAAPMHWSAKTMAFIVGLAFGAVALIALGDGTDALGIFAANRWTKVVLGAAAAALLLMSMMPRAGGGTEPAPTKGRRMTGRDPAARTRTRRIPERETEDRENREPVGAASRDESTRKD